MSLQVSDFICSAQLMQQLLKNELFTTRESRLPWTSYHSLHKNSLPFTARSTRHKPHSANHSSLSKLTQA